jgi:hypothetical protein
LYFRDCPGGSAGAIPKIQKIKLPSWRAILFFSFMEAVVEIRLFDRRRKQPLSFARFSSKPNYFFLKDIHQNVQKN